MGAAASVEGPNSPVRRQSILEGMSGKKVVVAGSTERRTSLTAATESIKRFIGRQSSLDRKLAYSICEYEDRMYKIFNHDEVVRKLFVKFIKLGQWMDQFREAPESALMTLLMDALQKEGMPNLVIEEDCEVMSTGGETSASAPTLKRTPTKQGVFDPTNLLKSNKSERFVPPPMPLSQSSRGASMRSGPLSRATSTRDLSSLPSMSSIPSMTSFMSKSTNSIVSLHHQESFKEPMHAREMLSLLFVALYPLFLESRMYKAHFNRKSTPAITGSQQFQLSDFILSVDSGDYIGGSSEDVHRREGTGHAMTLFLEAANAFDTDHMLNILGNPLWLHVHRPSAIIDNAFVSVSIFAGSHGFPLIYVNKAFEKLTGYSAADVLGQPCQLLQGQAASAIDAVNMADALKEQKAVKLEMTNYTKAGKELNNFLIMTPVFDKDELLSYVVSIQFDTTERDVTLRDLQMSKDILAMMPYLLLH